MNDDYLIVNLVDFFSEKIKGHRPKQGEKKCLKKHHQSWTTELVKVGDFDRQDELWKPIQFRTRNMNWNQIIVEILIQTNTLPET